MEETIHSDNLATMEFSLAWESDEAHHSDALYAPRVNFYRDLLPAPLQKEISGRRAGEVLTFSFGPGEIVPARRPERVAQIKAGEVDTAFMPGQVVEPRPGRYYPLGMLNRGLAGVFRDNCIPFRCLDRDGGGLTADLNHPLAGRSLQFTATMHDVRPKFDEHGGTSTDWAEMAVSGPGMQARHARRPTDFFSGTPFQRQDEKDDALFYVQPRMVQHLDRTAAAQIDALYGRLLPPGGRVLDLMSSWTSHLPESLTLAEAVGLGMNRAELEANPRLGERIVQDLNKKPELPFPSASFDAAVCTVSVEYLTRPAAVFAEVARVLRPGGRFVVTFSDRWFPPKAIALWSELHPFERIGLVLAYFLESEAFTGLETWSRQGLPRPEDDKYYPERLRSDPIFAVWGSRAAHNE